jgi:hypothetical protein
MRAILIGLAETIFIMPMLECVCKPFLDGLPAVNRSYIRHKNRVFGVNRGIGSCIVFVECLVILLNKRINLLNYLGPSV